MEHNSPFSSFGYTPCLLSIKCQLCIMTSFQTIQYENGVKKKSNCTVEKFDKDYLSQEIKINIKNNVMLGQAWWLTPIIPAL